MQPLIILRVSQPLPLPPSHLRGTEDSEVEAAAPSHLAGDAPDVRELLGALILTPSPALALTINPLSHPHTNLNPNPKPNPDANPNPNPHPNQVRCARRCSRVSTVSLVGPRRCCWSTARSRQRCNSRLSPTLTQL